MNYLKIYNDLMKKGKNNIFNNNEYFEDEYFEEHHINPKSLGGNNNPDNLVKLTFREHFIAHWLLYRIYPDNKELAAAFHISAFGNNVRETRKKYKFYMPSSRALEEARIAKIKSRKGRKHSEETLNKMRETWLNKKNNGYIQKNNKDREITDEQKKNISLSKIGKKRSEETKIKISETKKRQYQEYLKKNNGVKRKISQDTKNKIRNKALERAQKKK